ncbi:unnamed protein product [Rangifer tarandus platyrhynchus]|uniref:Uncharacterized protein n=3 Tax=Rangifer tarandus platyrhynchus TaxID=3082113 RepID=A0AC59YI35_RANTA|nr:unnamed protein product [Rangifer tarandus platyrhynchus]CAI9695377.1 unnamed protein product [Rangifer tarandus platyrhynchus]
MIIHCCPILLICDVTPGWEVPSSLGLRTFTPWLSAPVGGWELPGLRVPKPWESTYPGATLEPVGGPAATRRPRTPTSSSGPPVPLGLRLGRSGSNRWTTRSGQAEGAATEIPGPLSNRPWDSASTACPAAPAAPRTPPRVPAPANSGEGPAHPRALLGKFNFDGHAPNGGPALRGPWKYWIAVLGPPLLQTWLVEWASPGGRNFAPKSGRARETGIRKMEPPRRCCGQPRHTAISSRAGFESTSS